MTRILGLAGWLISIFVTANSPSVEGWLTDFVVVDNLTEVLSWAYLCRHGFNLVYFCLLLPQA